MTWNATQKTILLDSFWLSEIELAAERSEMARKQELILALQGKRIFHCYYISLIISKVCIKDDLEICYQFES